MEQLFQVVSADQNGPLLGLLFVAAAIVGALGCAALFVLFRILRGGRQPATFKDFPINHVTQQLADQQRFQAELAGRMRMLADVFASRQNDLAQSLTARVDGLSHQLGQTVTAQGQATGAHLAKIGERLAVIDRARETLTALSGQVTDLSTLLGDKQARGAFGQGQMEAILRDMLPAGRYQFQATLSSGVRPDALVELPGDTPPLVIDAKFPLEAFQRLDQSETPEEAKVAARALRRDMLKHIVDIRDRYLIPGETHETALLFLPAESLFARLHESFPDIIQKAFEVRVVLVSPSLLVLAVHVIQHVLKDAHISAAARDIQVQVTALSGDIQALAGAVQKLRRHHDQTSEDLDKILALSDRVSKHAKRIDDLQLGEEHHHTNRQFEELKVNHAS